MHIYLPGQTRNYLGSWRGCYPTLLMSKLRLRGGRVIQSMKGSWNLNSCTWIPNQCVLPSQLCSLCSVLGVGQATVPALRVGTDTP